VSNRQSDEHNDPTTRFDRLFAAHHTDIYRYCIRRLGRFDADDATAEVFAVVWRRLDTLPSDGYERAWLYSIAYRVIGNQYRSRRRGQSLAARLRSNETHAAGSSDVDVSPPDEVERLMHALEDLSPTDAELLRLSSWEDLSRAEIASVLRIKENAVDQRLHRARARLRARIERLEQGRSSIEPKEASA
jgi:RNA polymerase sigma-70 factor, ECF subfamily